MSRSEQMSHHRGGAKACPKVMSMSGPSQNRWMVAIVDRLVSLGRSWNGRTTFWAVQHGMICFANTTTMVIFVIRCIFFTFAGARIIPRLACLSRGVGIRLGRGWIIKDARPNRRRFLSIADWNEWRKVLAWSRISLVSCHVIRRCSTCLAMNLWNERTLHHV